MHVKSEERLVGAVPRVVTVGGDFVDAQVLVTPTEKVVPRVGSSSVCRAPRKSNRPTRIVTGPVSQGALLKFNGPGRTVTGLVSHGGVHSVAPVPSVDILDDVNFSKWVLEYGSDELHEFLFSYSGRTVSRDDIRSLASGAQLNTAVLFEKIDRLKVARFSESLGADFALGPHRTWDDVHLVSYAWCVKTKRLEIIDNSASTEATQLKYGDTPENVMLRLQYMKELCTVDINAHRTSNVARALRFLSGQ
nr:uncharacterized protein LOC109189836 [Ipomoea trifida]